MLALHTEAEKWACSPGDVLRCKVKLRHTAIDTPGPSTVWIDWLAAQCCGFCTRHNAAAAAEFSLAPVTTATSLPDETQMGAVHGRTCFLASSPQASSRRPCLVPSTYTSSLWQVVAAGLQLEVGVSATFTISICLPQQSLPPSFEGHAASYEYVLVLSFRTMAPPSGGSAWERGPICSHRLPLHILCTEGPARRSVRVSSLCAPLHPCAFRPAAD